MGIARELDGRVALVTGGGHGIGRAIALRLAAAGAAVAVAGRRADLLEATVGEIGAAGANGLGVVCDVTDPEAVDALREHLARWRAPVDVLVNNAGIAGPTAPLVEVSADEWDAVMAVNVRGVFLCCRAFLPGMIQRGDGDVINLASVSGKRPLARRTPYCASKMAVIGLTSTLALEVGRFGVRVNALSPGPVIGERVRGVLERAARAAGVSCEEVERAWVGQSALGRMVTEDEVAEAALAMLRMRGMSAADIDLSAGMVA